MRCPICGFHMSPTTDSKILKCNNCHHLGDQLDNDTIEILRKELNNKA